MNNYFDKKIEAKIASFTREKIIGMLDELSDYTGKSCDADTETLETLRVILKDNIDNGFIPVSALIEDESENEDRNPFDENFFGHS